MIKKLFDLIESCGVKAFFPAKKTGKCTEPYAVVKEEKTVSGVTGKSVTGYFTVSVIAPVESYSSLGIAEKNIKAVLKNSPFKFCGSEDRRSDEDIGAYIRDLSYTATKRNL